MTPSHLEQGWTLPMHPSMLLYDERYRRPIILLLPAVFRALVASELIYRRHNLMVFAAFALAARVEYYRAVSEPMVLSVPVGQYGWRSGCP